jgi:hypothetical protein
VSLKLFYFFVALFFAPFFSVADFVGLILPLVVLETAFLTVLTAFGSSSFMDPTFSFALDPATPPMTAPTAAPSGPSKEPAAAPAAAPPAKPNADVSPDFSDFFDLAILFSGLDIIELHQQFIGHFPATFVPDNWRAIQPSLELRMPS